ncbi:hypothetical protein LC613_15090 [Nostoc sphaeroides CHAB 2801]|uniref:hypothetical protein n=1 Tax=Nostoc sphaeroides TaxID=446679 RepID=UPI001C700959|nr:hypothetical protein [Nostoc sphaeroides]MCC5629322.1 hypothetical protein [Nostoc sphaeroides CHAB 2801]
MLSVRDFQVKKYSIAIVDSQQPTVNSQQSTVNSQRLECGIIYFLEFPKLSQNY